jgi:hypothetical protein
MVNVLGLCLEALDAAIDTPAVEISEISEFAPYRDKGALKGNAFGFGCLDQLT